MRRISVKWLPVGLIVGVTARVEESRDIQIKLTLTHSRLKPPRPLPKLGEDLELTISPPVAASWLQTVVCVPNGQTVVLGGEDARSDEDTLLAALLTARIVERATAR